MRHEDLTDLSFSEQELEEIRNAEASGRLGRPSDQSTKPHTQPRLRNTLGWLWVLTSLVVLVYALFRLWRP